MTRNLKENWKNLCQMHRWMFCMRFMIMEASLIVFTVIQANKRVTNKIHQENGITVTYK
jgi:hypothetical protein